MANDLHHEAARILSDETLDMHRAIVSLTEELEAIDLYQQRAAACLDAPLRDVFLHNRNEEVEHASMLLEWIRRHDAHFGTMLRTYLFTEAPLPAIEKQGSARGALSSVPPRSGT